MFGSFETLKDTQEEIIANGCLHDFNDGEFRHNVPSTFGIKMLCRELFNPFWDAKALDGLPIEFSEPLVRAPEPEAIEFTLSNGDIVHPLCVTLAPANEPNEMTTLLTLGYYGQAGPEGVSPTKLRIVGDIEFQNKADPRGLIYNGDDLEYTNSVIELNHVSLEEFTLDGEQLENPWSGVERFPNHCQQIYPSTTHRLRLVFNGGVSRGLDGPLKYDQNDFYLITDGDGNRLPSSHILGLADIGVGPDNEQHDNDNFIDICLNLSDSDISRVKQFAFVCDENTKVFPPKGPAYGPCKSSLHNL